jgi:hypothetical protein
MADDGTAFFSWTIVQILEAGDAICEKESVKSALRSSRWGLLDASNTAERYSVAIAWDCLLEINTGY